jgi:phenylalanyl-tRNA synthetase beta chain
MLIALSWLHEYVEIGVDPGTLADRLTLAGLGVEEVIHRRANFEGIVVAEITGLRPHPGGGTNQIVRIATSDRTLEVVSGAPNLSVGDRVPYAPVGSRLGDMRLTSKTVRGVESPGMLCSPAELGVGDDAGGILILDRSALVGADLKELYPDDTIFDLEITSNRPDLLCYLGVAREVAAILKTPFRPPMGLKGPDLQPDGVDVAIDSGLCRRFTACLLRSVEVKPSPPWMQARLRAAGVRPISNVVDITNYVMLETGQPMHAFDFDRLEGGRLRVRLARSGETLECLDGKTRTLGTDMVVVADGQRAQAIAGVIGGGATAVTGQTTSVLLEAATWEPRRVRAVSRQLGLRTEASVRFEKGLSPAIAPEAVRRATALLHQLAGATPAADADRYPEPVRHAAIEISEKRLAQILGVDIPIGEAAGILERLDFTVRTEGDRLAAVPPLRRLDCRLPEDLAEEVGRIFGYDRVPSTLPGHREPVGAVLEPPDPGDVVRDVLSGSGFDEAMTFTEEGRRAALAIHLPQAPAAAEAIRNSLMEGRDALRLSLLPGLMAALASNARQDQMGARLFAIGTGFWPGGDGGRPQEPRLLAMAAHLPQARSEPAVRELRVLEAVLQLVAERLNSGPTALAAATATGFHPGRTASLARDGNILGVVGEVHPAVLVAMDLPGRVVAAEVMLDRLAGPLPRTPQMAALPRFPGSLRDLTVVIRGHLAAAALAQVIRELGGYTLREVSMLSEFEGPQLGPDARSLSFRLLYQAEDRTLTSDEVSRLHDRIVKGLEDRFKGQVQV